MYQVLTDKRPYPILDQKKISGFALTRRIVENHLRPEFTVEINKSLEKLIKQCWDKDPKARPTFKEIFYKLAYNCEIDIFKEEKNQYYLDGVDMDQLFAYIDSITGSNNGSNNIESLLKSHLSQFEHTLSIYKDEIQGLIKEIQILKEKDQLKDEEIAKQPMLVS